MLRRFLDPYENVLYPECQLGGDDALLLLCDLRDSAAHTHCVSIGHEVPEGNWYCEDCRPTAIASSNEQVLNPSQSWSKFKFVCWIFSCCECSGDF
ncbi:chromodomain-helicase-DNA-binding 5-like isoform X1, partial [Olea europaea subsp. europaea]